MLMRCSAAVIALLAIMPTQASTAQPPEPRAEFGEELEVTEVLLDVLVTDARGQIIVGLDKDDFNVVEAGEQVELTGVTFYSNREFMENIDVARELRVDAAQVPDFRFFIFFFHDQKRANAEAIGLLGQQVRAGRESRTWVQEQMLPNDYVAVVSYDHKLKVHQDFTRNPRAVLDALDDAISGKDPGGNWPSRIDPDSDASLLRNLPKGKELRKKTTTIYDGLSVLAEATASIPGRKNLLLFTIGFGDIGPFGQYQPDARYYRPMMRILNTNNVAVYAIDLTPTGVEHVMASAMNQLALDTGGRYHFNFTSFITPLRQVSEENNGYYLLAYQSNYSAGTSGYRQVTVAARNPEFKVRARKGYNYGE